MYVSYLVSGTSERKFIDSLILSNNTENFVHFSNMLKFDFLRLLRFMFPLRVSEEARNKFLFGHTNHLLACAQIFISFLFFILYIYIYFCYFNDNIRMLRETWSLFLKHSEQSLNENNRPERRKLLQHANRFPIVSKI